MDAEVLYKKTVPDMTPERMDDIIARSIQSDLMQKAHRGKKKKGTLFSDKTLANGDDCCNFHVTRMQSD